jgi:hypothetical protein
MGTRILCACRAADERDELTPSHVICHSIRPAKGAPVLAHTAPFRQAALGTELIGAYLIGSLAHTKFSRRYSDVDIALITETGLSQQALDRTASVGEIAFQNKAVVYAILFRAAAETLATIAADPRHLGAKLGVTMVLHTWGQTLQHHLSALGVQTVGARLFRRLFLRELENAFGSQEHLQADQINLHADQIPRALIRNVAGTGP